MGLPVFMWDRNRKFNQESMTMINEKLSADVAIARTDADQRRISGSESNYHPDGVGDSVAPAGAKHAETTVARNKAITTGGAQFATNRRIAAVEK